MCVLAHLLYRGKCKHENRWLYRSQLYTRTNTHTHPPTYTHAGYISHLFHSLWNVTWISRASVKAAARAHASVEHAAGMFYSFSEQKSNCRCDARMEQSTNLPGEKCRNKIKRCCQVTSWPKSVFSTVLTLRRCYILFSFEEISWTTTRITTDVSMSVIHLWPTCLSLVKKKLKSIH